MTSIQLAYRQHLENVRHNQATEAQAKSELAEANRHNLVYEGETNRHNLAYEYESNRHNVATENETQKHNRADEAIRRLQANASWNQALAALSQADTASRQADQNILESESRVKNIDASTAGAELYNYVKENTKYAQIAREWTSVIGNFVGTADRMATTLAPYLGIA